MADRCFNGWSPYPPISITSSNYFCSYPNLLQWLVSHFQEFCQYCHPSSPKTLFSPPAFSFPVVNRLEVRLGPIFSPSPVPVPAPLISYISVPSPILWCRDSRMVNASDLVVCGRGFKLVPVMAAVQTTPLNLRL